MENGQQWYGDVGLYDLRNRFYSPDIGRFLQPDPIGFRGDRSNLYRYCRNNPVTRRDPSGLANSIGETLGTEITYPRVWVTAPYFSLAETAAYNYYGAPLGIGFYDPGLGFIRGSYYGPGRGGFGSGWGGTPFRLPENDEPGVAHLLPSSVPSQNPENQSLLPESGGFIGSVAGEAGWGEGMTASYSAAFGDFGSDNGAPNYGSFQSYGGFLGGPSGAARLVDSNQTNLVLGGAVGPSVGLWFSNATSNANVMGPFSSYFVSTPWFNASYSVSGNRYYIITVTYPGSGLAYSQYTTNTISFGGH